MPFLFLENLDFQTDRQRNRQRDKDTDRMTKRHTDRQREQTDIIKGESVPPKNKVDNIFLSGQNQCHSTRVKKVLF